MAFNKNVDNIMKDRVILGLFSMMWFGLIYISSVFAPAITEITFFGGALVCGIIFVYLLDLRL